MKSSLIGIVAASALATPTNASRSTTFVSPRRGHVLPVAISFKSRGQKSANACFYPSRMTPNDEDANTDEEGANLASEFFKSMKERDFALDGDELDWADAEEGEFEGGDSVEEDEIDFPQGAINAFTGIDRGDLGDKLSGETSLTNQQIYDEMKERVLESAGGFVELTKRVDFEDDGDGIATPSKVYSPPEKVPDSGLTAGEVVHTVLSALRNCDDPTPDRGIEILFSFSSRLSQITELVETEALTPAKYREFLRTSEDNNVLFDHEEVIIDKASYSPDKLKAYFTARLCTADSTEGESVNFILSTTGADDDDCWLVDSVSIRPQKLSRRWRR